MIWILVIGFILTFFAGMNLGSIDPIAKNRNYWITVTALIIGLGSFLGSGLVLVIRLLK